MKLSYDKDADALTIVLKKGKIVKDKPLSENVFAGYSQKGELLEVQFLDISDSERPYLTVEAVAKILNKSERTILRWIQEGRLPSKKVGREYQIDPLDIESLTA